MSLSPASPIRASIRKPQLSSESPTPASDVSQYGKAFTTPYQPIRNPYVNDPSNSTLITPNFYVALSLASPTAAQKIGTPGSKRGSEERKRKYDDRSESSFDEAASSSDGAASGSNDSLDTVPVSDLEGPAFHTPEKLRELFNQLVYQAIHGSLDSRKPQRDERVQAMTTLDTKVISPSISATEADEKAKRIFSCFNKFVDLDAKLIEENQVPKFKKNNANIKNDDKFQQLTTMINDLQSSDLSFINLLCDSSQITELLSTINVNLNSNNQQQLTQAFSDSKTLITTLKNLFKNNVKPKLFNTCFMIGNGFSFSGTREKSALFQAILPEMRLLSDHSEEKRNDNLIVELRSIREISYLKKTNPSSHITETLNLFESAYQTSYDAFFGSRINLSVETLKKLKEIFQKLFQTSLTLKIDTAPKAITNAELVEIIKRDLAYLATIPNFYQLIQLFTNQHGQSILLFDDDTAKKWAEQFLTRILSLMTSQCAENYVEDNSDRTYYCIVKRTETISGVEQEKISQHEIRTIEEHGDYKLVEFKNCSSCAARAWEIARKTRIKQQIKTATTKAAKLSKHASPTVLTNLFQSPQCRPCDEGTIENNKTQSVKTEDFPSPVQRMKLSASAMD